MHPDRRIPLYHPSRLRIHEFIHILRPCIHALERMTGHQRLLQTLRRVCWLRHHLLRKDGLPDRRSRVGAWLAEVDEVTLANWLL